MALLLIFRHPELHSHVVAGRTCPAVHASHAAQLACPAAAHPALSIPAAVLQYCFSATNTAGAVMAACNVSPGEWMCICATTVPACPVHPRGYAMPCTLLLAGQPHCSTMWSFQPPTPLPAALVQVEAQSTVLITSGETDFKELLCTGNPVTWDSMQIWVVTDAGEGLRSDIPGTVITSACT